jgi:hypothetical protein
MKKVQKHPFVIITGGKEEIERQKSILFSTPEALNQQDFERLCDSLKLRLDEVEPLIARRVRYRNYSDKLEQQTLLAIIEGRDGDVKRLFGVLDRRNALSLEVITSSEPASPAQFVSIDTEHL